MSTMTRLQGKAEEAAQWFETARRDENDPESTFVRTKEGAPEWVTNLVFAAHGDFLPDDFRYEGIKNALDWISEEEDEEGDAYEFAYSNVSDYTGELLSWLSSNLRRVAYVDEVSEELGEEVGLVQSIVRGQAAELAEIYSSVRRSLES